MERFTVTHGAQCMTVVFASTLAHVDAALRALMAFAQQQQIPCSLFDLELVLREALTNAAEHGNHLAPRLQVQCVMQAGPKVLQITIADEGKVILQLPAHFGIPVVIVQHMPPMFTGGAQHGAQ